jgi:hypothetical protein
LPGDLEYPYLFHKILSYLKKEFVYKYRNFISFFIDIIMCSMIAIYWITEHYHNKHIEQFFLLLCLVFTNPGWCSKLVGPRSYNLTARVFGELAVLLFMLSLFYYPTFDIELIFCMSFFTAIILLSSQFALQYIIILLFLLSIINLDDHFIYILIGGFLISTLFTRGQFIRNLSGKYYHTKKYINQHIKINPQFKNKDKNLYLKFKYSMLGKSIFCFPVIALTLYLIIVNDSYNSLSHQIILITIFIYLLTSFGIFRVIGEGVRYLDFITFPCYYLIINESDLYVIYFLILIQTIFFLMNIIRSLKHKAISKHKYLRSLVTYRKINNFNPNIVLPYTSSTPWSFWYFTSAKIVFTLCHSDKYWKNRNYNEYYNDYPNLSKKKFELLLKEYNVDCIIVSKSLLNEIKDYLSDFKESFSSATTIVYTKSVL